MSAERLTERQEKMLLALNDQSGRPLRRSQLADLCGLPKAAHDEHAAAQFHEAYDALRDEGYVFETPRAHVRGYAEIFITGRGFLYLRDRSMFAISQTTEGRP